ncbi:hypothetical protein BDK51DRAFT_41955 [Blyttiomyces helicus]|uniref:Uncharacterized protein n=1 Tax=Blyttiomyces helicus TaxID=388810 RepID=A0A4P9WLW8_9FUNG|nr:hypothetical protein BDK51DRAFT_41955 [Blyttiomyces helicus]|eukprot:RKO93422.1 hypothetical protein BDK51DRAFT_41955 [Blyttiomyces helicus]
MSTTKDLAGKVAVDTGASRGIGKAYATELASRVADFVITCRPEYSRVDATVAVAEIQELGVRALHVQSDAGSVDSGRKLLGEIKRELAKIDIIVNNAGDIGSGFTNLTVLWMARCSLRDLDGIGSLSNLTELYLANNDVVDLSCVGFLEMLEILDLEG